MAECKDLLNTKINNLRNICSYKESNKTYWVCRCDCGKFTIRRQDNKPMDCGCRISNNVTGKVFGNFTVIKDFSNFVKYSENKTRIYCLCKCICGSIKEYRRESVLSNKSKSCGCLQRTQHGMSTHYLYKTYNNIKSRCFNTNNHAYKDYGGRGITLYNPWISNFLDFIDYIENNLGDRPDGHTLDRINNNKGYEPDNLKWSNHTEQCNNKRQVKSNYDYNLLKQENEILKHKNEYLLSIIGDLSNV
jgi:hypothetical protein